MSQFAEILARWVWGWLMWFVRRPAVKRFQNNALQNGPEKMRPMRRRWMVANNRFARRYGRMILTGAFNFLFASFIIAACLQAAMYMFDHGLLTMSSELKEKVSSRRSAGF